MGNITNMVDLLNNHKMRLPRKKKKAIRKKVAKELFKYGYEIRVWGFTVNEYEYN